MATQRDINESQELQDRGIKREFRNIHQKLDEQRSYMNDRFQQVDDRFQELEVLIKNSRATSGWDNIYPVRVQDPLAEPQNRYQTPPHFPSKVVKFWHLQRPRHSRQLIELLRFYSIRASDLTTAMFEDNDDADTESESSSESKFTLEEAVKANPAFALARLAAKIGLDYSSINHNMGLYEQIQIVKAQQETQRAKREQSDGEDKKGKDIARPLKKAAISEVIQAQRSGLSIPIEELTACPEAFSFKSPQAQSHVSWAPRPKGDSLPSRASASSSKKTATPPSQPSKGSTIPFTPTPSVIKDSGKTTSSKHSQTSEETSF
jgi:hypothetical protein